MQLVPPTRLFTMARLPLAQVAVLVATVQPPVCESGWTYISIGHG
tara:strand:+ start:149 stop:283 length:135 start_codon:yes stop_codon:yes gene_type:complete